jgi:hypothetical protein
MVPQAETARGWDCQWVKTARGGVPDTPEFEIKVSGDFPAAPQRRKLQGKPRFPDLHAPDHFPRFPVFGLVKFGFHFNLPDQYGSFL